MGAPHCLQWCVMPQSFDVCIRGAGIVGQALALVLARHRLRVALVKSHAAPADQADVRAYALNSASRQLLDSVRCWPDPEHATPVLHMRVQGDAAGQVAFDAVSSPRPVDPSHPPHEPALAWIVDVPRLHTLLGEAVRFQSFIEWVDAPVDAPLTVVCEGRASVSREQWGVDFATTAYPQQAIATRLRCTLPHQQTARQWFYRDGIVAFLPLDGAQGNSVAVVWSISHDLAPQTHALPPEAFTAQLEQLSGGALGCLELIADRHLWPLQLAKANHWCGTIATSPGHALASWVLAGDAAHTVHPLAGQGLNLGLADAHALAQHVSRRAYWRSVADLGALRAYERERKAALWSMALATDGLQQVFSRSEAPVQTLRNWGMNRFEHSGAIKQWIVRRAMGISS